MLSICIRSIALLSAGLVGLVAAEVVATPAAVTSVAAPASVINAGDTAWMLVSTALVLFMTIPGLALFYGGLVRTKNVLTVLAKCFAITCLVSILWVLFGYSLAFDRTGMEAGVINLHSFIGSFANWGLLKTTIDSVSPFAPTIPETVFIAFQLTFAIITPALLIGAFAERIKFSAVMVFSAVWLVLVYIPICHMSWGGEGSLMGGHLGLLDTAGGTVVEINSGIAGLVAAVLVGRRLGYPHDPIMPHNVPFCILGAGMLWVGWFGFNAGSIYTAGAGAGMALLTTHIAGAAAGAVYMLLEWLKIGKPSTLGIATGAVAGLVAITPACGFVGPLGALAIGGLAAVTSFLAITKLKRIAGYDDSLDVFGVHGVGGLVGTILTGVFGAAVLGGQKAGLDIGHQTWVQIQCALITTLWSGLGTAGILIVIDKVIGLRVSENVEFSGLDVALHGEAAYNH